VIINCDLNIDQNNRDYHFGPNRAALSEWLQKKKRDCNGPCENKGTYWKGIKCSC